MCDSYFSASLPQGSRESAHTQISLTQVAEPQYVPTVFFLSLVGRSVHVLFSKGPLFPSEAMLQRLRPFQVFFFLSLFCLFVFCSVCSVFSTFSFSILHLSENWLEAPKKTIGIMYFILTHSNPVDNAVAEGW